MFAVTTLILHQHIFELFLIHPSTHPKYVNINISENQQKLPFFWPHLSSLSTDIDIGHSTFGFLDLTTALPNL